MKVPSCLRYLPLLYMAVFFSFFSVSQSQDKSIVRLVSIDTALTIPALNGKAIIAHEKKLFEAYLEENFVNWGLNKSGLATSQTKVQVYELISNGTLIQMFAGITTDLDKLVMSQNQVINFCRKYPQLLSKEGYTNFLLKENAEYFVASVCMSVDGLLVYVSRLGNSDVLYANWIHRVVVPQLA